MPARKRIVQVTSAAAAAVLTVGVAVFGLDSQASGRTVDADSSWGGLAPLSAPAVPTPIGSASPADSSWGG